MNNSIDCLFIGHNEIDFHAYEKRIRAQGVDSGVYRDLNLNFIYHQDRPYTASAVMDECSARENSLGSVFSAAIAYLGSYLQRRGYSFDYVNDFKQEQEYLASLLEQRKILTIAIITTLYVDMAPILEIMKFIRQFNTSAKIVIGGPYILAQTRSLEPAQLDYLFQAMGADYYIVSSQGENTLATLLEALKNNPSGNDLSAIPDISNIPNIYYMDLEENRNNGLRYRFTSACAEDNPLSGNMVNWTLFKQRVGEQAAVRTAISCPFSCSFCGYPLYAGKYRTAGVAGVQKELDLLASIPGLKSVNIIDDTFNVPVDRFKEILRMMIRQRYPFKWHSYFRCQFADEETVALMKESGCEGVFLGLESGADAVLKNMKKAASPDKYRQGIKLLKQYRIPAFGSFIIGFPGETEETVWQSYHLIEDFGLDFFRVQLWFCDPTTPIMKQKESFGLQGQHFSWSHDTMDWRTAADWVDRLFLKVKNAVWVPQYHFNIQNIFGLMNRGMDLDGVKQFLRLFNGAIAARLENPAARNIQPENWEQMTRLTGTMPGMPIDMEKYNADFDL